MARISQIFRSSLVVGHRFFFVLATVGLAIAASVAVDRPEPVPIVVVVGMTGMLFVAESCRDLAATASRLESDEDTPQDRRATRAELYLRDGPPLGTAIASASLLLVVVPLAVAVGGGDHDPKPAQLRAILQISDARVENSVLAMRLACAGGQCPPFSLSLEFRNGSVTQVLASGAFASSASGRLALPIERTRARDLLTRLRGDSAGLRIRIRFVDRRLPSLVTSVGR